MKKYLIPLLLLCIFPASSYAVKKASAGGSYTFRVENSAEKYLCMDIAGGKAKPGSRVQIYSCKEDIKENYNQRWTLTGLNELVGHGGLCLDAYDKGGAIGAQLKMQPCNGSQFQKWTFAYPGGEIVSKWPNVMIKSSKGHCIGVTKGKMNSKTPLELMDCARKRFTVLQQRESQSAHSGACAKKVRNLNKKYLTDLGGANDFDAEKVCDDKKNDVFEAFRFYLTTTISRFRDHTLDKARRTLGH